MSSSGNWCNFLGNLAEMENEMVPFKVGTKVLGCFKSGKGAAKPYKGKVIEYDILTKLYTVRYDPDGHEERKITDKKMILMERSQKSNR